MKLLIDKPISDIVIKPRGLGAPGTPIIDVFPELRNFNKLKVYVCENCGYVEIYLE